MQKLSERLTETRKARKMRLREVAAETRLSISFISDVERGRVTPSLDACQRIADCYRVSLAGLFSGVRIFDKV